MKYITTDKHPALKKGIELLYNGHSLYYEYGNHNIWLHNTVEHALKEGYIKEVEEKEFTKSDMIVFANRWYNDYSGHCVKTETALDLWLKEGRIK